MVVKNFLTVRQLAEKHPANSQSSIRWLLFTQPPGFKNCVRRLGRKILIEESAYLEWLDGNKA